MGTYMYEVVRSVIPNSECLLQSSGENGRLHVLKLTITYAVLVASNFVLNCRWFLHAAIPLVRK